MSFEQKLCSSKTGFSRIFSSGRAPVVLFSAILFLSSCSLPNLEEQECIEARETVKQFYSAHFGNEFKTDADSLTRRKELLTPRLLDELGGQTGQAKDYFTQTEDYPKAFRVGRCEALTDERAVFEVLLFWKSEARSEQKEIAVETVKTNGPWRIDKVSSKP